MSTIKRIFSKSADKLKRVFSINGSESAFICSPVDIVVPSLDVAFIQLELSPDLNELCNATYNQRNFGR